MSIAYRAMRPGQEDAVAIQLRQFARELKAPHPPTITGEGLRAASDLVRVHVAEDSGLLVGLCTWMTIFSTWRGIKGMYCCDLFVMEHMRARRVGEQLLRHAARDAQQLGARFIKLEVNAENMRTHGFYERLGFHHAPTDRLMFLETAEFETFTGAIT